MGLLQPHGGYVGGVCEGDWVTLLKPIMGLLVLAVPVLVIWFFLLKSKGVKPDRDGSNFANSYSNITHDGSSGDGHGN